MGNRVKRTIPEGTTLDMKSNRIANMIARMPDEREMNRAIHIWEEPAFIFLSNPICACSTLKMSLNLSVARVSGRSDFTITDPKMIHRRSENLLKTPRQLGYDRFESMLDDPKVTVFAFVRDPHSRFLSAWSKKLAHETPHVAQVRRHLDVGPDVPLDRFLSLDQFASEVRRDSALRDLNGHWRLQRNQIFFDDLPMTVHGRIENFAADAQRIFTRIFGADRYILRDAVTLNPANASRNHKLGKSLSPSAKADVAEAYAPDSAMLEEIARRAGL